MHNKNPHIVIKVVYGVAERRNTRIALKRMMKRLRNCSPSETCIGNKVLR